MDFFIGVVFMATLIGLLNFWHHQRYIYIYYSGYIFSTTFYAFFHSELGQYIHGLFLHTYKDLGILFSLNLGLLFFTLFIRQYLNIDDTSPKWWLKLNPIWLNLFFNIAFLFINFSGNINQKNSNIWASQMGYLAGLGYFILWTCYIKEILKHNPQKSWIYLLSIFIILTTFFTKELFTETKVVSGLPSASSVFKFALITNIFITTIGLIYRTKIDQKALKYLQPITENQPANFYWTQQQNRKVNSTTIGLQNELQLQRERLARDLHDGIGSQLTHIITKLDMLAIKSEQARQLGLLSDFARETNQILRETIWVLNHEFIEYTLFQQRMSGFLTRIWEERDQPELKISMTENSNLLISPIVAMTIFRIGQEVINNALKYSNADCIEILFRQRTNTIVVEMGDNGRGFDTQKVRNGYGLDNIKKRCSELGGELHLCSSSNGTIVIVELPPTESNML